MSTIVEEYKALCADAKIKANSAVVKQLAEIDDPAAVTNLDFEGNMVGTKGAVVLAKLAKKSLPKLESVSFSGNNVGSPATEELYKAFVDHPAIARIDLSSNDVRLGGPALVELVKKNKRIVELNVQGTFLRPLFERLIAINVQNNKAQAEKASQSVNKRAQFTFGDPADDDNEEFKQAEEEAFGAFGNFDTANHAVTFSKDAQGGKKVKRRPTVSAEVIQEEDVDNFKPQVYEKEEKTRQWLSHVLEHHDLFSHLDDRELLICVDAAVEAERAAGDTIFEEGDEDGDLFYVIGSGEVDLLQDGEVVKTLKRGDCTQDLMLLYVGEYTETARCTTDVVIYSLDRMTYKCAVSQASKKKRAMYEGFLSSVEKFKCLTPHEILQLADALKPAIYQPGQKLIKYGEDGTTFYLIVEGTVEVYGRDDKGESVKVCEFTVGDCVGELEFLNDHKCVADVVAKDELRVAKMNRHHFEMVMGPVKEVLARTANEDEKFAYYRNQLEKMNESQATPAKEGDDGAAKEDKKE
mmetsp:Transcript_4197/g.13382  ORF Transcript_4197/g.13382 Transcript_4197/m.13382 type:complete len:523 (-) Transcript_4197:362-1930(-)|eukprot:CAMPEP_0174850036 /NCGR_PEP_ID=MMETSP1114-20130205/18738_1 /TAXON_ID=312471 /ORGANISM="Neobodo designis, Strain CCAP 1951/1" /LENGTH=522 /DNA_ID=CAMNT_0016084459 /DNA_START=149 /DNA_END=1717 /DNA_ORIENTATION=+